MPLGQLAGVSRMALRAYDACEAGDERMPRRCSTA